MFDLVQSATFAKWESSLRDKRARGAIAARLFRLANGLPGDVSPVGSAISELRIDFGPGYRIYFKQQAATIILLLCGGEKGSQAQDIRLAKRVARDWSNNHE